MLTIKPEIPILSSSTQHLSCSTCLLASVITERLARRGLKPENLKCSYHAVQRAAQRNLSCEDIQYVTIYGKKFYCAGALFFFLRRCDIPEGDRTEDRWSRLEGTSVILTKDGRTVITVWRNRRTGLRRIKRKSKHDARPKDRDGSWTRIQ